MQLFHYEELNILIQPTGIIIVAITVYLSSGIRLNYKQKYSAQQLFIKENYATFDVPYNGTDNNDYADGDGFCCNDGSPEAAQARAMAAKGNFQEPDAYEKLQFYYHPDHLGSSSYITNLDGEVVQHIEYVPFGEVFMEERNSIWNTPYLFNAKEFDEETGLYYYGARYYDSRLSVWISIDPMQEKYADYSTYCYTFNNPIRFIDPTGMEGGELEDGSGYYKASKNTRTIGFGIRHPFIALQIGEVKSGSTNISTNSTRFATRGEVLSGSRPRIEEERGSETGAVRHTLWQAAITSEFGESIANQVGNAHEDDPFVDLSNRTFSDITDADRTVDLLNNIIGRNIGSKNKGKDMKELSLLVLTEFKDNGLFTATQDNDGNWQVTKTKLSQEKYDRLSDIFKGLNKNAFTPLEQKQYDTRTQQKLMQKQITWGTMK